MSTSWRRGSTGTSSSPRSSGWRPSWARTTGCAPGSAFRASRRRGLQQAVRKRFAERGWTRRTLARIEGLWRDDRAEAIAAAIQAGPDGRDRAGARARGAASGPRSRGDRPGRALAARRREGRAWVPVAAADVLGDGGSRLILSLTRDREPEVRDAAVAALLSLGSNASRLVLPDTARGLHSRLGGGEDRGDAGTCGRRRRNRARGHRRACRRGRLAGGASNGLRSRADAPGEELVIEVRNRVQAEAFTTLDGSTIRVLLDAQLEAPPSRAWPRRRSRPALGRGVTITREPRRST